MSDENGRPAAPRTVLQPLALAFLAVAVVGLALHRYLDLGEAAAGDWFTALLLRALRDPFCLGMVIIFASLGLYAVLQLLGVALDVRAAEDRPTNALLAFLAGRSSEDGGAAPDLAGILAPLQFGIWVLPLLGFIGTVVGITAAIGGLEEMLARAGGPAPEGVRQLMSGLRFAFDTTFVGLSLVIPLMLLLVWLRAVVLRSAPEAEDRP